VQQDNQSSTAKRHSSCDSNRNKSDPCSEHPTVVDVHRSADGDSVLGSVERDDVSVVVSAPADTDREELNAALSEAAGAIATYGWRIGGER